MISIFSMLYGISKNKTKYLTTYKRNVPNFNMVELAVINKNFDIASG